MQSPAQDIQHKLENNTSKILFTIFICIVYLCALYVFVGIVTFLGAEVGDMWDKDRSVSELYNSPYCLPFKIGGIIGIILYVFRNQKTR